MQRNYIIRTNRIPIGTIKTNANLYKTLGTELHGQTATTVNRSAPERHKTRVGQTDQTDQTEQVKKTVCNLYVARDGLEHRNGYRDALLVKTY